MSLLDSDLSLELNNLFKEKNEKNQDWAGWYKEFVSYHEKMAVLFEEKVILQEDHMRCNEGSIQFALNSIKSIQDQIDLCEKQISWHEEAYQSNDDQAHRYWERGASQGESCALLNEEEALFHAGRVDYHQNKIDQYKQVIDLLKDWIPRHKQRACFLQEEKTPLHQVLICFYRDAASFHRNTACGKIDLDRMKSQLDLWKEICTRQNELHDRQNELRVRETEAIDFDRQKKHDIYIYWQEFINRAKDLNSRWKEIRADCNKLHAGNDGFDTRYRDLKTRRTQLATVALQLLKHPALVETKKSVWKLLTLCSLLKLKEEKERDPALLTAIVVLDQVLIWIVEPSFLFKMIKILELKP
jgi:hypothetical protein